ncbi:MAG TPA: hypothetical protein VF718_06995 [Allosphingosinicella sp.]|jgi:hypothetical protein
MTIGDIASVALGLSVAGAVLWAMWPRSRTRAGPRNNWRQRSGDEIESGKAGAAGDFDSPYLIAMDVSPD